MCYICYIYIYIIFFEAPAICHHRPMFHNAPMRSSLFFRLSKSWKRYPKISKNGWFNHGLTMKKRVVYHG